MAENIRACARRIAKILKTDRWIFLVCDGEMGEGKSCFTAQLGKAIAEETGIPFSYEENMTYLRKELKTWIDGDKEGKNQKPEHSTILADELISMFFKRNWFDAEQIDGIELLNKCRDRHLCVEGNIPSFWDLDSAMYPLITLWVHIHERGRAWLFQKDRNPFTSDKWHRKANEKLFKKHHNPYRCHGFLCEIHFEDWPKEERDEYYRIRNQKRTRTEGQRAKQERYKDIKVQRDAAIKLCFTLDENLTDQTLADVMGMSGEAIRLIKAGQR